MENKFPEIIDYERDVLLLECQCGTSDHMIKVTYDRDWPDQPGEITISVQLRSWRSFLERLCVATKYVFGRYERWGHWDCTILNSKDFDKLREFMNKVEESEAEKSGSKKV